MGERGTWQILPCKAMCSGIGDERALQCSAMQCDAGQRVESV